MSMAVNKCEGSRPDIYSAVVAMVALTGFLFANELCCISIASKAI
jgi:hypothetical protein